MQELQIEYGTGWLDVWVEQSVDVRGMKPAPPPLDAAAIGQALDAPIGTDSLTLLAGRALKRSPKARAVIVVSDNTRPVPYRGKDGLMLPMLRRLLEAGFPQHRIQVLIGAGSHRNMQADEIEAMLGLRAAGLEAVVVVNHEYDNPEHLTYLGETQAGSAVWINRSYLEAELKIVTGLVESHFMAGASGGRKGICPGIVGKETLNIFHGGKFLSSQQAADLILEGNPLHEEASEVASMAGCDFLVNATIDAEKRLTGVFAGDLFAAHQAAVAHIRDYVSVDLPHRYDIVVIPAGFVGVNHYQAAKAAIEAARAVTPGGYILIVAKHTDPDPVGGAGYKQALNLLAAEGPQGFMERILRSDWQMIQEQWQVQMWCKVLEAIQHESHLIYCALELEPEVCEGLPGTYMIQHLGREELENQPPEALMQAMVRQGLDLAVAQSDVPQPRVLLLKDGPYGIPQLPVQQST